MRGRYDYEKRPMECLRPDKREISMPCEWCGRNPMSCGSGNVSGLYPRQRQIM